MQNSNDIYMQNADAESMRQQLCHIYQTADKVTEYLINRERNARVLSDTDFFIVDVRLEPTCKWMVVYYTIIQNGRQRREQYPMLWSTFYELSKKTDTRKSKNPWTMETTVFRDGFDPTRPPSYTLRPLCREVTPEEACQILQEQARAFNNDDDELPK